MVKENLASTTLQSAQSDATVLRRDSQQMQDRIIQLIKDETSDQEKVRQLNSDLAAAVRDRQQLLGDRDAAVSRSQTAEKDLAAAQTRMGFRLPMDYFDLAQGTMTPAGTEGLSAVAATSRLSINPLLIYVPESAVPIVKKFFSEAGVPESRIVIVSER